MIRAATFSFLLFIFSFCKTPKTNSTSADSLDADINTQIIGKWQWVKTNCCSRMPSITTPETAKKTMAKNFRSDSTVDIIRNDSLIKTSGYRIFSGMQDEKRKMISIDEGRPAYLMISHDTMTIDFGYIDLQTEWYVKVK